MTTSYKLEAFKELRKQKQAEREKEVKELAEKEAAEAKAHAENLKRIAKKMAIIESGGVVPNPKPATEEKAEKPAKKVAKPVKKKAANKRGRPAGSKNKKK